MVVMKNKAVVKLWLADAKSKKAAKKALVNIEGLSSITLDFEKSTLVVMGDVDPTNLVLKLRKFVSADLMTYGPEKVEVKSEKNNGGGVGNFDQKPQLQKYTPYNNGMGTYSYY